MPQGKTLWHSMMCCVVLCASAFLPSRALAEEAGGKIYRSLCASCHGADLTGGHGPSLVDGNWLYGPSDVDIIRAIKKGYSNRGMPAFENRLAVDEIQTLVRYIRTQGSEYLRLSNSSGVFPDSKTVPREVQSGQQRFRIESVAEGLGRSWAFAFVPDGRILLVEVERGLQVIERGKRERTQVQGLSVCAGSKGLGYQDVKLHPDYDQNGWIYLSYDCDGEQRGDTWYGMLSIVRGRLDHGALENQEGIWHPLRDYYVPSINHNGGRLTFDERGYLYFSVGTYGSILGGSAYADSLVAQDLHQPMGKIHRIRPDGRVPSDNPFVDSPEAYASIWTLGHRNPQGLTVDLRTGSLWSSEHGAAGGDELNLIDGGRNYGWPIVSWGLTYDGAAAPSGGAEEGIEQPIVNWTPSIGVSAITFYEGDAFPKWKHNLFVASLRSQELLRVVLDGSRVVTREVLLHGIGRIRDIHSGPDGYLYLLINGTSRGRDRLIRLVPL